MHRWIIGLKPCEYDIYKYRELTSYWLFLTVQYNTTGRSSEIRMSIFCQWRNMVFCIYIIFDHVPGSSLRSPKPRWPGANCSRGSSALGENFRAKRWQISVGWSLYKQVLPSRILFRNPSVMSTLPNVAGWAPPLDQSTQVTVLFASKWGASMVSIVGK